MRSSKYEVFLYLIFIFFGDMRLEKYTYDVRNLGQAVGAHKVGASARTSQNPLKSLRFQWNA
jgi:hypothetical protein